MTGFVNCFCPRPDIAVLARPRKLPVREHAGARGRAKELARGQSGIRATPYKCPRYPCKCSRDPVTLLARPYGTFARGQKAFASEHPDARSTPTNARVRTPPMAPQTAFTLAASFTCLPADVHEARVRPVEKKRQLPRGSTFRNHRSGKWCEHRPAKTPVKMATVFGCDQQLWSSQGFSRRSKSGHHRGTQSFTPVILRSFDPVIDEDIGRLRRASACGQPSIGRDDASSSDRARLMKLHPVPIGQRLRAGGCGCREHEIVHWLKLPTCRYRTSQFLIRAAQFQVMPWRGDVMCDCAQPIA